MGWNGGDDDDGVIECLGEEVFSLCRTSTNRNRYSLSVMSLGLGLQR